MGSSTYDSINKLERFLRRFLPESDRDSAYAAPDGQGEKDAEDVGGAAGEHIQLSCSYCGLSGAHMPIDITDPPDRICPLCKEEAVQDTDQLYQTVDETIRNVKYMFSVPWDKRIQVRRCSRLKKPAGERKKKKDSSTWTVSLEPRFVQAELDDGRELCVFKIRAAIPSGIVAATVAYTVIYDYLHRENNLDQGQSAGLSYWYMVHYLCCTDQERYTRRYNQSVGQLISSAGAERYRELQRERGIQSSRIFFVGSDLALERREKEGRLPVIAKKSFLEEDGNAAPDKRKEKPG